MGFEGSTTPAAFAEALRFAALYLGLLVALGIGLSVPVMLRRRAARVGVGDGGDDILLRRIRIHGNFVEQAALIAPLLALAPFAGAPSLVIHLIGGSMLLGRVLHAQGLAAGPGPTFGRVAGMALSWTSLSLAAVAVPLYAFVTGTAFSLIAR
jgi:uncharacterized membrane protein YecN with MAPEG domain